LFDIDVLLNRLDQLESKNEQQGIKVAGLEAKAAEQEVKVAGLEVKVEEHQMKISSQQEEIGQLKKKNFDLEEKNNQLILAKEGDVISRDFLPRSCFEIKATNPNAQSGVYSIDPDGQIGADQPIQVYCDMTTRNSRIII